MSGCTECEANEFGAGGSTMCQACDPNKGEYSNAGASKCEICRSPKYIDNHGKCVDCTGMPATVSGVPVCKSKRMRRHRYETPW